MGADMVAVDQRVLSITSLFKDISKVQVDSICGNWCSSKAKSAAAQATTSGQALSFSSGTAASGTAATCAPEFITCATAELQQTLASSGMGGATSGKIGPTDGPATQAATPTARNAGLPASIQKLVLASKPYEPLSKRFAFGTPCNAARAWQQAA